MTRTRWIATSLALHIVLFWLLSRAVVDQPVPRPPVELKLVVHEPKAPRARPLQAPSRSGSDAATPRAVKGPRVTTVVEPNAAPNSGPSAAPRINGSGGNNGGGGGLVSLNPQGIAGIAGEKPIGFEAPTGVVTPFLDDGLSEKQRVEKRVAADNERIGVALDTRTGARGTVAALRRQLKETFTPPAAMVAHIPYSGAATAQIFRNKMDAVNRPRATGVFETGLTPAQREILQGMVLGDSCAQSHEVGRMEAKLHVEHDERGQAVNVTVLASSGNDAFDSYAQTAMKAALHDGLKAFADEAIPLFSDWSLAQVVYDWSSTPGCFDPQIRMPGLPVFPDSRRPYAVTYTSDVTMIAVRYRHPPRK